MAYQIISQDYLKFIFDYKDGVLYWKNKTSINSNAIVGRKAGSLNQNGYVNVSICNRMFKVHRIIFMMHHGYMPKFVDHINGIKNDNRIENLRPATKSENALNSKCRKNIKNVYWHKASKKWMVQITVNKKQKTIGYYDDLELAELVAIEARDKYHGKFARHT